MEMKAIFKFTLIFILLWIGTKSIIDIAKGEDSLLDLIIDITLFILFIGSPATSFWGRAIDNAINDSDEDQNKEN